MSDAPSFAALPLAEPLRRAVAELGYATPTPIQARALPPLLEGRDVVGRSRTGSGKTVAFALPLLQRVRVDVRALQALVLCPTRELAAQVAREVRKLGRHLPELRVVELSGGQPLRPQAHGLEGGAHVAVGTPGRCIDHLGKGTLDLGDVGVVVLDEADRMLEMGFREDVERLLAETPEDRQTALFSATFPRAVEALCASVLRDPVEVEVEDEAPPDIRQEAVVVEDDDKAAALLRLLADRRPASALVFCNFKATVVEIARALADAGWSVAALHGDLEQVDRDRAMARFRNGSVRVLVATDVAARGIDVEDLPLVVNADLAPKPDVHVHRVGRTGRAGRGGVAVSLATPRDERKLAWFETETGAHIERVALPEAVDAAPPEPAPFETLLVFGGRKDKLRPGDLLGALTGDAGLAAAQVGKIELHDRVTFVAVARDVAATALRRLSEGRIKARRFRVERVR